MVVIAMVIAAVALIYAQQRSVAPERIPFDVHAVFPRETSPGQYAQVDIKELQLLAEQGWELVGVTPYIYRNEERNIGEMRGPKPVVTQTYPAYYFKRLKNPHY